MKAWIIAWQDIRIRLRDYNAFILMLLAPIVLAAIMGAALGHVIVADAGTKDAKLIVVNEDKGERGKDFVAALSNANLEGLFQLINADDLPAARRVFETGNASAIIEIPEDFTRVLQQAESAGAGPDAMPAELRLFADPGDGDALAAVRDLVAESLSRLNADILSQRSALRQQQVSKREEHSTVAVDAGARESGYRSFAININNVSAGEHAVPFNSFAFFAPSMAIFFLMFTMFDAPRTILVERQTGTLGRLLRSPTSAREILLGKLGGSFLTGILQFSILVIASRLIFSLKWGSSLPGLILMVLSVVMAASSMGAVIAAYSKNVNQAEVLGGGIAIISAGLGGSFFPPERLPSWLQPFSRLTINRWGLEGFTDLTIHGLGFKEILPDACVLLAIAVILFILAFWKFQRRITN